jgi:hypothetical protein
MKIVSYILLTLSLAFSQVVNAQDEESLLKGRTIYNYEYAFGGKIFSNGFAINGYYAKHTSYTKRQVYHFEISTLQHQKEIRSFAPYSNARGYFFGKSNSVFLLKGGFGRQNIKYEKFRHKAVAIGYTWSAGPSLAILKPIYIEVQEPGSRTPARIEQFDPEKHFRSITSSGYLETNIAGRAPWSRGLEETFVMPSLNFNVGLIFENAPEDDALRMLEVGVCVDLFASEVPIMAFDVNSFYYFGLYLSVRYGKKKNL